MSTSSVCAGPGGVGRIVLPGHHLDEAVHPGSCLLEQRRELLVVHHQAGVLPLQHVTQLRRREPGVEQQRVGADPGGSGEALHQTAVVPAEDPERARTVPEELLQRDCRGVAAPVELAPGQGATFVHRARSPSGCARPRG